MSISSNSQSNYSLEDILGESITHEEALSIIASDANTLRIFKSFPHAEQEKLISFIQGNQGLQIMHDGFAKHVLDPALHPERLKSFLSAVLDEDVKILEVLTLEGCQLSEKGSLVIMDLLVKLTDGSMVNVEIQQIGYAFPGERAGCYQSDLVMRQYNLVRSERGSAFSYHDMKPVCLIVIMEQSSKEFLAVSPHYIHRELHSYDSGAKAVNLFKTIYISLDTFRKISQNVDKEIDSMLHAWLTFFGSDSPADIVKLVNSYPEFLAYYKDITEFRRHPKELITMFSEALAIMDHNTELYMIDEMRKEKELLNEEKELLRKGNDELRKGNDKLRKELDQNRKELDKSRNIISLAVRSLRNQGKSDEEIREELGLEDLPL